MNSFDALLVVSFGGPEKREDVMPFLENVLRGKNVPRERMLEVAEHYYHFDGRSPINEQNRQLIAALEQEFKSHDIKMPVYWGNRNWHPLLPDTLRQMQADGVRRAAAFVTSAFGSYSGCRQYREDIARALEAAGVEDLVIEKLPNFCDRPEFIEAMTERVRAAMTQLPGAEQLIFTAHSIPVSMAESSPYLRQLKEASARVAAACGMSNWTLVYQSRSGPPSATVAGARISATICGRSTQAGVRSVIVCPDRLHLRPHGGALRSGYGSARGMRRDRHEDGARRHGRRAPKAGRMIRDMVMNAQTSGVLAHCEAGCCPAPQRPAAGQASH